MHGNGLSGSTPDFLEVAATDDGPPPFQLTGGHLCETPLIFASPHSGRHYPNDLMRAAALNRSSIRKSEDALVDQLIESAVSFGVPLIVATHGRAYIDLNREPYELDQSMFEDELPTYANMRTARVVAGLGSIARIVAEGQEIYRGKLLFADALSRIKKIHEPYHRALRDLLSTVRSKHGVAVLIDWHSMPSAAAGAGIGSADFVLGDRFGSSCARKIIDYVERNLHQRGYVVGRNAPYAGGYTTELYGRPSAGINALQIEVNRRLYLNEDSLQPNDGFAELASNIRHLIAGLVQADWSECSNAIMAG